MNIRIREILMVAVAAVAVACGGNSGGKADGPEDVLTEFYAAVTEGDWCRAEELCDTLTMKEYISGQMETRETLMKEDSCAFAIAAAMLSESSIDIKAVEKADGGRKVLFSIRTYGYEKEHNAFVVKKEGKWKVAAITDVN